MFLDNMGLIGDAHRGKTLSFVDRFLIPLITFLVCTFIMAGVGMLPGIEGFIGGGESGP